MILAKIIVYSVKFIFFHNFIFMDPHAYKKPALAIYRYHLRRRLPFVLEGRACQYHPDSYNLLHPYLPNVGSFRGIGN